MEQRSAKRLNRTVSVVGLGCWQLGADWGNVDEADAPAVLHRVVDREAADRDNRRLARNLKTARLRTPACVEDIDFRRPRGLDRAQILALAQPG